MLSVLETPHKMVYLKILSLLIYFKPLIFALIWHKATPEMVDAY